MSETPTSGTSLKSPPPPPRNRSDEVQRRNTYHAESFKDHKGISLEELRIGGKEEGEETETLKLTLLQKWKESIQKNDGATLLQLIVEEVGQLDYKPKSLKKDYEIVTQMVQQMNSILTHAFLKVNFQSSQREIENTDWSNLCACQKSESGSVGIYFLQCGEKHPNNNNNNQNHHQSGNLKMNANNPQTVFSEIIVAKAFTKPDYERTFFIAELASHYFQINTPVTRYIEREENEFKEIEKVMKQLFQPLFSDLYEIGGSSSPKGLFSSEGIMLLQFIHGKPLMHRMGGQRSLTTDDYYEIGKIFLFDLLIRNTDRFPCRKALPRPMAVSITDEGNPGNILFGPNPGEVWSIDPELQINVDPTLQNTYSIALKSVVEEILFRQDLDYRYQSIETLFFQTIPGLEDVLPVSLNEIQNWDQQDSFVIRAIASVLDLLKTKIEKNHEIIPPSVVLPTDYNERKWREVIRQIAPRAMKDIFHFIESQTYMRPTDYAPLADAFVKGFQTSVHAALEFLKEYISPSTLSNSRIKLKLQNSADKEASIKIPFVLDMIGTIKPVWEIITEIHSTGLLSPKPTLRRQMSSGSGNYTLLHRSSSLY